MFLPSNYAGGSVLIHNGGNAKRHTFGRHLGVSLFDVHYIAYFSDATFEMCEITSGFCSILAYDLFWKGNSPAPSCARISEDSESVIGLLKTEWDDSPEALIFPLEHKYSESILVFGESIFRGKDANLASALRIHNKQLSTRNKLSLYVAKACKEEDRNATLNFDDDNWDGSKSIEFWHSFEGKVVSHPEALMLDLDSCLVAERSYDLWGSPVKKRKSDEGDLDSGEKYERNVVVVIKKDVEEDLFKERCNINQMADYILENCHSDKWEAAANVNWLLANRKDQLKASNNYQNYYKLGYSTQAINTLLIAIAHMNLPPLFDDFVKKVVIESEKIRLCDIEDSIRNCLHSMEFNLIDDTILSVMERKCKEAEPSVSVAPDISCCIRLVETLDLLGVSSIAPICKMLAPHVQAASRYLDSSERSVFLKLVKAKLPNEAFDFTYNLMSMCSMAYLTELTKLETPLEKLNRVPIDFQVDNSDLKECCDGLQSLLSSVEGELKDLSVNQILSYFNVMKAEQPDVIETLAKKVIDIKSATRPSDAIMLIKKLVNAGLAKMPKLLAATKQFLTGNIDLMRSADVVDFMELLKDSGFLKDFRQVVLMIKDDINRPCDLENILELTRGRFGINFVKGELQSLVKARVERLTSTLAKEKDLRIPDATVPGHPKVEAFLRGPEFYMTYCSAFNSIMDARIWLKTQFKGGIYVSKGVEVSATACGRGKSSYVIIQKAKFVDYQLRYQLGRYKDELASLKELLS